MLAERIATEIAMLQLIGAAVFRARVAAPAARAAVADGDSSEYARRLDTFAGRTAVIAAMLLVALAFVRLHVQVTALFDGWGGADARQVRALIGGSLWGRAWLLQLVASLGVLTGALIRRPLEAWMILPLAIGAALNGHAAGVANLAPAAVGMQTMHILSAGAWVGGVLFLLVATNLTGHPRDLLRVVRAFNVVALVCVPVILATGVFAAVVHLRSVDAIRSSAYGNQLAIKVALVAAMLLAGAWNWRRATRSLVRGDTTAIRYGVAGELALALAVIVATARLVELPLPGMQ